MTHRDSLKPRLWLLSGLAVGVLTPLSATAAYERSTGTACQPNATTFGYGVNTVRAMADNYSTTNALSLTCPVPDTTDMPHATINQVRVEGYDGCNDSACSVMAKLCAWNGTSGGGCGTFVWTVSDDVLPTDVGYFSMTIGDYTALNDATENAYLWISLPKSDQATSRLSSIYFANPASLSTEAYSERRTAASCQPEAPTIVHNYQLNTGGLELQNVDTVVAEFVCPIPDKTKLPKSLINVIQVDVYDGNNDAGLAVSARACAFNGATGTGGSCGTADYSDSSSTFVGHDRLLPGTSTLADVGETPYLFLSLPKADGDNSGIKGMYFSKPAG